MKSLLQRSVGWNGIFFLTWAQSDLSAMLARKSHLSQSRSAAMMTMERSRLVQERTLAERRMDFDEAKEIDQKLKELNASTDGSAAQVTISEEEDKLAKVNKRNQKANLEAVHRAELAEAERNAS
jgi:RNA polymerase-associated protein RTF1